MKTIPITRDEIIDYISSYYSIYWTGSCSEFVFYDMARLDEKCRLKFNHREFYKNDDGTYCYKKL